MIKLGRLIENNGAYLSATPDEDKTLLQDSRYMYLFDESMHSIQHVWTSTHTPGRLQLPPVDYSSQDFKGIKDFTDCKAIMESNSESKLIRKKQKDIVETIAKGKINIGAHAFSRVCPKHIDKGITLVVTGNAGIKFLPSSFGKGKFELILPPDMKLYKVMDKDSRSRVCTNERYMIASSIIDPQNPEYSDKMIDSVFETVRIIPVSEINTPNLSIKVNPDLVYHKKGEAILSQKEFADQLKKDQLEYAQDGKIM